MHPVWKAGRCRSYNSHSVAVPERTRIWSKSGVKFLTDALLTFFVHFQVTPWELPSLFLWLLSTPPPPTFLAPSECRLLKPPPMKFIASTFYLLQLLNHSLPDCPQAISSFLFPLYPTPPLLASATKPRLLLALCLGQLHPALFQFVPRVLQPASKTVSAVGLTNIVLSR